MLQNPSSPSDEGNIETDLTCLVSVRARRGGRTTRYSSIIGYVKKGKLRYSPWGEGNRTLPLGKIQRPRLPDVNVQGTRSLVLTALESLSFPTLPFLFNSLPHLRGRVPTVLRRHNCPLKISHTHVSQRP